MLKIMSPFKRSNFSYISYRVILVASVHLVLVLYGIVLTVADMIREQYPLTMYELAHVLAYYFIHFTMIALLILGMKHELSILYVPWILVFLTVFTTATYFWIDSMLKGVTSNIVNLVINITVLGFGWMGWCLVTTDFLLVCQTTRHRYAKIGDQ